MRERMDTPFRQRGAFQPKGLPRPRQRIAPVPICNFSPSELIWSSQPSMFKAVGRHTGPSSPRLLERRNVLNQLFRQRTDAEILSRAYGHLVTQSRQPILYTDYAVPDTVIGRFDMITLHAFLVFRRLKTQDPEAESFCQNLFDHMFTDMDRSLREMGVGDLSVGKKVKALARGFYGRVVAYERALDAEGDAELQDALIRNVYPLSEPPAAAVAGLAHYVRLQAAALAEQPVTEFLAGRLRFAEVGGTATTQEPSGSRAFSEADASP